MFLPRFGIMCVAVRCKKIPSGLRGNPLSRADLSTMKRPASEIQTELLDSQKKSRNVLETFRGSFGDLEKNYEQYMKAVKRGTRDDYDHIYYKENFTDVLKACAEPMSACLSKLVGSGDMPEAYDSEFDGQVTDSMDYFGDIITETSSPSTELMICINEIFDEFTNIINSVPDVIHNPVAMWAELTDAKKKAVVGALMSEGYEPHSDEFFTLMKEYREIGIPSNSAAADVL